MSTFTKAKLSGSTDGRAILVVPTSTPGTLIHTAVSGTINFDEIWLFAQNNDIVDRILTIAWGGVSSPTDLIIAIVPAQDTSGGSGLVLVVPGLILQNGLLVRAFANAANVVTISGFVNQIA